MTRRCLILLCLISPAVAAAAEPPLDLGSRRELFVDHYLIDRLDGARLDLQRPVDQGSVFAFDKAWEGMRPGPQWPSSCGLRSGGASLGPPVPGPPPSVLPVPGHFQSSRAAG
jgi:hypothetical protein